METIFGFAAVVLATLISVFAALALEGLLLKVAFQLMQPATAHRKVVVPVEDGTRMVARVFLRETR